MTRGPAHLQASALQNPPLSAVLAPVSETAFSRYAPSLICLYALVAALSIAASQVVVVALTLWWLASDRDAARTRRQLASPAEKKAIAAASLFLGCALVAAVLGLDPGRAAAELVKLWFALLFPFVIASTLDPRACSLSAVGARIEQYLLAFGLGQLVAGMHTLGSQWHGQELPIGIPGPVTESGQLVLILTLLIGVSLRCYTDGCNATQLRSWSFALGIGALACLTAWPELVSLRYARSIQAAVLLLVSGLVVLQLTRVYRADTSIAAAFHRLRPLLLAILLAVLVINLKRGPWLGLLSAVVLFGCFYSKRLVYSSIFIALAALALIKPVQERLAAFAVHFSIAGGRQSMWEIGLELLQRFPLGLGLKNARYMRVVDPTLPDLHRHMHNNLLNIAVETGFLGLACYIWCFLLLGVIAVQIYRAPTTVVEARRLKVVAIAVACALLGWQVSGLVEYNFGDSEIRLIALTFVGMLLAIARHYTALSSSKQTVS